MASNLIWPPIPGPYIGYSSEMVPNGFIFILLLSTESPSSKTTSNALYLMKFTEHIHE